MKNPLTRLEELEKQAGTAMVLLAEVDGEQRKMSAKEFAEAPDAIFRRVVSGSSLRDLDIILDTFGEVGAGKNEP